MLKIRYRFCFILLLVLLNSGCATINALQLVYGNDLAQQSWLSDQKHTTVPFEYLNQHTIVKVSVDDAPDLRMILDTGAAATVLFETERTRSFVNRIKHKIAIGGIGENDTAYAYFLHNTRVTIGSAEISGLTTLFIKAEDNPVFANPEVTYADGVIGYDLFSRFVTKIDFDQQTVVIAEPKLAENTPLLSSDSYQQLPLFIENNLPFVDIHLAGVNQTTEFRAMFDTGAIGSLIVRKNPQLPESEPLYQSTISGMGGESSVSVARFSAIHIGNNKIPNIVASISQDQAAHNIVGSGLINRFNLIIDYPTQQLLIFPNGNFYTEERMNLFGATLLPHIDGAFVNVVRENSLAEKLGIQKYDVIVTVNGEKIHRHNFDNHYDKLTRLNSLQKICYRSDSSDTCVNIDSIAQASNK